MNLNTQKGPLCRVFGIPFLKFALPHFADHKKELIEKAYFLIKKQRKKNKSNLGGFHSDEIGAKDWNNFDAGKWFIKSINDALCQSTELLIGSDQQTPEIANSWYVVNRAENGDWNAPHTHPNSFFSGVLYVSAQPKKIGTGKFIAIVENYSINSIQFNRGEDTKLIEYIPIEGELLIFPSSVIHMVSPHMANYDRISISFNTHKESNEE